MKTREIEARGKLLQLAVDVGALGAGYGPGIKNTIRALSALCEDDTLSADAVMNAIYPVASARNMETQVLDAMLDTLEIFSEQAEPTKVEALLLALLSSCREREYAGVHMHTLERIVELAEIYV